MNVRKSGAVPFRAVADFMALGRGGAVDAARAHVLLSAAVALLYLASGLRLLGGGNSSAVSAMTPRGLKQARARTAAPPAAASPNISSGSPPLLRDPLAALVEKELRTFARIPRFRMAYAMSCIFGIVVFLPLLRDPLPDSFFIRNALPLMALYGLLMLGPITYWNAFGFDRSAAQGYFCWPVRFRDALMAKNIAVAILLIPQILIIALVGKAARLPSSPGKVVRNVVVISDRFALLVRHGEHLFGANTACDGSGKK